VNSISIFLKRALTFSGCLFLLVGLTGCDPELYAKVRAAVVKAQPELTTAQHDKIAGDLMMAYEKAGGDKAPSLENITYELDKAMGWESQPGFEKAYGAGWDVLRTHWTAKQSGGGSGGGSGGAPFLPGGAGGGGGGGGGGVPVPTPSPQPTPPPRLTPVPTPPQQYGN
jgi:uncharacterized membrane protein YgcG